MFSYIPDAFVNETINLIEEISKKDKQFYMFLSFTTPHAGGIGTVGYCIAVVIAEQNNRSIYFLFKNNENGIPGPSILPQYDSQEDWPEV